MSSSSDNEFEDPYNISSEETVGPLEIESTDTIKATMPDENESKPKKSICKSLAAHLNLLKEKVSELSAYLDKREADNTVSDQEIDTIQSKAKWIEDKYNKILRLWEDYLETDYEDDELDRAEPTYKQCGELSSKIRRRVDTFLKKAPRAAVQAAPGPASQASSYSGPPKTNDMLKPKKPLDENMTLEAALHWFKTYKNHLELNSAMLAQQTVGVRRGILENDIDSHMAYALGAHPEVKEDSTMEECLDILKKIFMERNPVWVRRKAWFECVQKDNETVIQWWNRKKDIAKQCDLKSMKDYELAMLQFMMGINRKEKKLRDEFLKQKDPKLEDLLEIARNWERSDDLNRDLDNVKAKKAVVDRQESDDEDVVEAKKAMSNYRRDKDKSWKEKHRDSGTNDSPNDNWSKQEEIKPTCSNCSKNPTPGGHGKDRCPALGRTCYGCGKEGHLIAACKSESSRTGRVTVGDVVVARRVYSGSASQDGPPRGGGGMGAPGGGGDGGMFEMNVPGHKVGLIIGRGGKTVKQLQERSGAKITIIQDSPKVTHEKPLKITGDPGAVEAAKELITEILNRNDGDVGGFSPPRKRFRQKFNGSRGRRGCIQCQSKKRPRCYQT